MVFDIDNIIYTIASFLGPIDKKENHLQRVVDHNSFISSYKIQKPFAFNYVYNYRHFCILELVNKQCRQVCQNTAFRIFLKSVAVIWWERKNYYIKLLGLDTSTPWYYSDFRCYAWVKNTNGKWKLLEKQLEYDLTDSEEEWEPSEFDHLTDWD
jgi:hypothetical protein